MKILVVDDINANLTMMQRLLKSNGHQVTTQANPLKALEIISEGLEIDVILVDYMMPEMKGSDFIKELHNLARYKNVGKNAIPPCILITAWSQEFTIGDALNMGFYSVLKKPFPNQELLETLGDISAGHFKNYKNILLINHDINEKVTFSKLLSQLQYRFYFAEDYDKAITYFQEDGQISAIVLKEDNLENESYKDFIDIIQHKHKSVSIAQKNTPPIILTTSSEEVFDQANTDPFIFFTLLEPMDLKVFVNIIRDIHQEEKPKTVLVVDDLGMDIMFLEKVFKKWNYQVLTAHTMEQTMNMLISDTSAELSMVICDLMTTNINGYELFKRYTAYKRQIDKDGCTNLPFLIITDSEDQKLIQDALNDGIKEIIRKPVNIGTLKRAMKQAAY